MRVLLSLAKPRYHLSYTAVIAAALLFASPYSGLVALRLAILFVSFDVLFYSGIASHPVPPRGRESDGVLPESRPTSAELRRELCERVRGQKHPQEREVGGGHQRQRDRACAAR